MRDKPPKKRPPGPLTHDRPPVPPEEAGRLTEDERGNMTWQWANDEVLQADDTAGAVERLRALVDPNLGIVVDEAAPSAVHNSRGLKTGYNPYNSGALGKIERKKKKNLRELSKWIKAKRKAKGSSGEPDSR
jgi:hypothetical protein